MIEGLPFYVSLVFILVTLSTVVLLLRAIPKAARNTFPSRLLSFVLPFWLLLQGVLSIGTFYQATDSVPPRVFAFGVLPSLVFIVAFFVFFRKSFVDELSLKALTLISVVRVFVEITLLWLYQAGQIPRIMTFEGFNFDILSGLTAIVVYFVAFRGGKINRPLLIVWNIFALGLLLNIVTIALLSFKGPIQKLGLEQPNVAVNYFPFVWLPTMVVPIVLFSHLAALRQLFRQDST